ncbi:MAG: ferrochelatase, partial [Candidatus Methanomethylophilaceae archaeon]|nr:ferrochelatase [Candidatus Methanomethylophilaceae archaeon]
GTRKGNLTEILEAQAASVRAITGLDVDVAYFRVSSPTIPEALEAMASRGIDRVVAVPFYIAEGTLTRELIPEKLGLQKYQNLGEVSVGGKNVVVYLASAFNFNNIVTDIISSRIAAAGGDCDSGILLLGHGTRDSTLMNREVVAHNARRLRWKGFDHVEHAFNEFCEPSIKDSIAKLASEGVDKIVCVPVFIAMGLHLGLEIPEQIGIPPYSDGGVIEVDGRKIEVRYTAPLGDDPRLATFVARKALQFLR